MAARRNARSRFAGRRGLLWLWPLILVAAVCSWWLLDRYVLPEKPFHIAPP